MTSITGMTRRRSPRPRSDAPGDDYHSRHDGRGDDHRTPIELGPASAYEALTRQLVERLADDLDEIKGRLNGLLFLVAGAVIIDAVTRLAT